MRVCAGETLAIRSEFAVEYGSMTLTFNLDGKKIQKRLNMKISESTKVDFQKCVRKKKRQL